MRARVQYAYFSNFHYFTIRDFHELHARPNISIPINRVCTTIKTNLIYLTALRVSCLRVRYCWIRTISNYTFTCDKHCSRGINKLPFVTSIFSRPFVINYTIRGLNRKHVPREQILYRINFFLS